MIPVYLTKIKTRDGLTLEGAYVKTLHKSEIALVYLHGLSSRFYSGQTLMAELSSACQKAGIGYFKFNNRGNNIISLGTKGLIGSAFEKFEDCVWDIKAVISLARKLGYKNIILAGHSTGANKILYYVYKTRDRTVKKMILLGPISDIAGEIKKRGRKKWKRGLEIARKLNKKQPNGLMPSEFGIWSAKRYLSLYDPGRAEDVFPYYNPQARWKELKSVKTPVAVIIGGRDEHSDRPVKNLIKIFSEKAVGAKKFSGIIIKGADHGFRKKEKELSQAVLDFIKSGL